jgi:hypothetical protein
MVCICIVFGKFTSGSVYLPQIDPIYLIPVQYVHITLTKSVREGKDSLARIDVVSFVLPLKRYS